VSGSAMVLSKCGGNVFGAWLALRVPIRDFLGGVPCARTNTTSNPTAFEVTSKRRRGFPSETHVKRGERIVGGSKELFEKLGRNDPCPCGSGRRFQTLLHAQRRVRWLRSRLLLLGSPVETSCQPPNKQTVLRRRVRAACASLHCARARRKRVISLYARAALGTWSRGR
jgi:hypothetical protein